MMNVAVSSDGTNWKPVLLLDNEAKAEFSYPAVIQTRDGLVHIIYTWKRQRLTYTVVKPEELVVGEFKDGQWPLLSFPVKQLECRQVCKNSSGVQQCIFVNAF